MEALVETQYEIMDAMKKLIENFKKDGADRKTPDKIKRKIDTLDQYWADFNTNHRKLEAIADPAHPYHENGEHEKTSKFYQSMRAFLVSHITKLPPPPQAGTSGSHNSESGPKPSKTTEAKDNNKDLLLRKQKSNIKAFERTAASVNLDKLEEKWQFEDALKALEARWTAVDSLYWEIDSLFDEIDGHYEMWYVDCEIRYQEMKTTINTKMWSFSHREKSTPKVELPIFSGSYQQWTSFKDLFMETIHNNPSLSKAQKMQHLKSKVKGEAEKLIHHLSISTENYDSAWEILEHRFNNKKLIFSSHLNTLLSVPTTQHLSASSIKKLHDVTNECLNAIKNLGVNISTWDPIIVHLLSQKLDTDTHNDYSESVKAKRELPKLSEFMDFLESKFTSLESSRRKQEIVKPTQQQHYSPSSPQKHSYKAFGAKQHKIKHTSYNYNSYNKKDYNEAFKCPYCENNHKLFACEAFLGLQPDAKRKTIAKNNLCKNCLFEHKSKECYSDKRCRVCNEKHNTLLHDVYGTSPCTPEAQSKRSSSSNHISQEHFIETLLATAMINVEAHDGSHISLRALIDQGSQISLITERAAQTLQLPREPSKGVVFGIGAKQNQFKGNMYIKCQGIDTDYTFSTNVFIMRELMKKLPNHSFIKSSEWSFLENIKLADPDFNRSRPIDILLGADVYSNIIQEGIIKYDNMTPVAQQTRLGWILFGNVQPTFQCNIIINDVDEIRKFWTMEDITENSSMTQEDLDCLQHYKSTTTRNEDGRYIVQLPLKPGFEEKLGVSKPSAIAQFKQLEKRFSRQQQLAEAYKAFMNEYQHLNHMVECTSNGNETPSCYLPHHAVQRPDSTTTATRVVFNPSAKTSTGYTLNDLMYRGPNLQQDIMVLILRWRQYPYVYTADIEKMYRQILCSNEHQKYQKIIWRDSPKQILREYQLTTVTYGMKAAPFLAMMTLKQLAIDEGHKYHNSRAAQAVQEEFYMDDLLSGSYTLIKAKQLQYDLINMLKSGGFNLRKWSSNQEELLEGVSTVKVNEEAFIFKQAESTKTLGLKWHPKTDSFTFQLKIDTETPVEKQTKRTLLSDISKIFDPLGWLSPVTTRMKLLFQQVFLSEMEWDDQLPSDISKEWKKIRSDLLHINSMNIHRWYRSSEFDKITLHGFCDASNKAYACVVYCKVNNNITLVAAKTRLIPINKKLTTPRLELCGAQLLSSLMSKIQLAIGNQMEVYCWCDSTAVLGWIHGDTDRWTPFVANRVKKIKEVLPLKCWRYIKSAENPADCASRGISAEQLQEHPLWWTGPIFLQTFDEQAAKESLNYVTNLEERKSKQTFVTTTRHSNDDVIQCILDKHSSLTRAVRVLSWILRVTIPKQERSSYLTIPELTRARHMIIKYVQEKEFAEEISNLKAKQAINSKSKLLAFNPFLTKDGLLRVGGRLKHANISDEMKHPLIIPHKSHLTDLIIDQAHRATFHAGARVTLSHIRQQYWIIGGNRAVKSQLRACTICKKHKAVMQQQIMGDLPAPRTNPTRPFHHTGVDFTGYVDVKTNKGRGVKTTKGYIAVFVCMATKAVHFELVSDMSSSAFLAALKRMSSRRGKPYHMYSDNGTNFVGADRALQQQLSEIQQIVTKELFSEISEMGINWHFNAPAWPSAGGLWEAAVKSLKYHLRRVVGEQKLTFEEYSTLLAQLEACLNSRPLCALTEDPDDLNYLTPSHFLSSGPILTVLDTEEDLRSRWHKTQQIFKDIWKRWQTEYLTQLSSRSKWQRAHDNLKQNDVVIIHDPNLPAGRWTLGRVTELHPGADGYVRVVTLKTKGGYFKRPVTKLTRLVAYPEKVPNPSSQAAETAETENQHTIKQKQSRESKPRTRRHKINLLQVFTTFFILLASALAKETTHHITALNKSLYFDRISNMQFVRDQWKLIVYYDMTPYWDGLATFEKYIQQIQHVCKTEEKKTLCDLILLQFTHTYDELKYYNSLLLHQHFETSTRKKRGLIDGVGYVANSLFGVLDQHFAEQYQKDIALIRENQKHLSLLWKNQTSVVEAEYNLLKRTETSINKQHKIINQHLNNLSTAVNNLNTKQQKIEIMNEVALSSIIVSNLLNELKSLQDTLLETIADIHHGVFNIHLLSPDQLRYELNIISGQLSRDLSLPMRNIQTEMANIYQLLEVKARVTEDNLIFEIKIPLVNREQYDLYRLIAVPQTVGNTSITILPISDYIAINLRKDNYLALTEADIQQCQKYDESTKLCHSRKPIFHYGSEDNLCVKDQKTSRCQIKIEACRNNWIELSTINTYMYYCCEQCALRIMCDQVTAIQVTKAGVIALEPDCVIKGEQFTIFSHQLRHSKIKTKSIIETEYIAPINHLINLSIPLMAINSSEQQQDREYHNIKEQIEQMKTENALIDGISYHDVHHYTAIYVLLGIILLASSAYTWRLCRRRARARSADLRSDSENSTRPPAEVRTSPIRREQPQRETVKMTNFSFSRNPTPKHPVPVPVFTKPSVSESD